jgi:ferric enterobactin receptor
MTSFFRTFAVLLLAAGTVQAQSRASLMGTVSSAAGAPIEFATITLHRAADSTVVKTEFSDSQGAFRLDAPAGARYRLSAAQVGFDRYWSAPFELPAAGLSLPAISLANSAATTLKEVTVTARKPLFERQADRTVVNVEGSTLAAGNTTLDVLGRSPGVTVDGNDNLGLRGRQGLLVLLDGKRVPMTGTELADMLRALPADQLKSIELITNPPAKYDAQGSAGIIAINLKKDQRLGTNGSLTASYGRGEYGKFGTGLTLNHRRKNLNLFGSYNFADRHGFQALTIHRDFYKDTTYRDRAPEKVFAGSSDQDNRMLVHTRSHSWKAGLDYNLGERTTVGLTVNGLANTLEQDGRNSSALYLADGSLQDRYQSTNTRNIDAPNAAANLNFKHTFADTTGTRELSADADYARYTTSRQQALDTRYEFARPNARLLSGDQSGELSIQSVKADYSQPLPHKMQLEAGVKASRVSTDNDVRFVNTVEGVSTVDPNQTNRFRYDENIGAAYLTISLNTPTLTLSAGLRGEQTIAEGRQDVKQEGVNANFTRNYFQLFPSAGLKKTLSKNHELALSLSRRIDRPGYGQLNPFRSWIDATTFGSGNPDLRPQTSYNVELTHTFKQKYSAGLAYSNTSSPIIGAVQPVSANSRFVVSRDINLTTQHTYTFTFTAPVEPAKWWSIYNNLVVNYSRFVGELAGTSLNRGRPSFSLSSNSTFVLGHGWGADLSANYDSRQVYGFFEFNPQGQLAAGIQKSVWGKKGSFKLNVSDAFYTLKTRATSSYDNYVERFYQRFDSRVATLSFTYRFGNDKLAPTRRRAGGAEDEKRRAG